MTEQFVNFADSIIVGAIDAITDPIDIVLATGSGIVFPQGSFRFVIDKEVFLADHRGSGGPVGGNIDTLFSCARGQEGSLKTSHAAGSVVRHMLTAAVIAELYQSRVPTPLSYGCKGDGVTFDDTNFGKLIQNEPHFRLPRGYSFRLQNPLTLGQYGPYNIDGVLGDTGNGSPSSKLLFAPGIPGLELRGSAVDQTILRGFAIESQSVQAGNDDGLWLNAVGRANIQSLIIRGFGRRLVNFIGNQNRDTDSNYLAVIHAVDGWGDAVYYIQGQGGGNGVANWNTLVHCTAFRPGSFHVGSPRTAHGFLVDNNHNHLIHPRVEGARQPGVTGDDYRMQGLGNFVDYPYAETGTNIARFTSSAADNIIRVKTRYAIPTFVYDTAAARYNNTVESQLHEVAGKGYRVNEGSSPNQDISGKVTLVGGQATVSTSAALLTSHILLTRKTAGGTLGFLGYTVVGGTSFTIRSTDAAGNLVADTSEIHWMIFEPA